MTFVIHYDGDTNTNVPKYVAEHMLNETNELFKQNGVKIFFYVKNIIHAGSNGFTENRPNMGSATAATLWMKNNRDPDGLSIHLSIDGDGYDGLAISPFFPFINKYVATVALKRPNYTKGIYDKYNSNTLAHEIGHTLGLLHTHHPGRRWIASLGDKTNADCSQCYQESVDHSRNNEWWCFVHFKGVGKKKCEINGDLLCDTDADPGQHKGNTPSSCEYFYSGTTYDYYRDSYGEDWLTLGRDNATRNIMSYNRNFSTCPTEITALQRADMYLYTLRHGPKALVKNNSKFYENDNIDIYENDNYWKPNYKTQHSSSKCNFC